MAAVSRRNKNHSLEAIMKTRPARTPVPPLGRREAIVGVATGLGALFLPLVTCADEQKAETKVRSANSTRTSLHQEVDFKATPQRIYDVLLDSKQFSAFTGAPAQVTPDAGAPFSLFGGGIVGRNVELVPAQRIVQAWRSGGWEPGVYSIVKFEFKPRGSQTTVILDHAGFAEGRYEHLYSGWKEHYWDGLQKFLA
jgi:activator of HSP90 ATPase